MDEEELQNPDTWDFENAEVKPGRKNGRAIVSVAFSREDFEAVCLAAEKRGMKLSAFIRATTLDSMKIPVVHLSVPPDSVTSASTRVFF